MKNELRRKLGDGVVLAASLLETVLAAIVLVALAISCLPTLMELPKLLTTGAEGFHDFLGTVLNLVIGVEFIEMLTKHSPGSALEVLLFATVRHMLVGHGAALDNLFSVASIAVIFLVRKFAFSPSFSEEHTAPPEHPEQPEQPEHPAAHAK